MHCSRTAAARVGHSVSQRDGAELRVGSRTFRVDGLQALARVELAGDPVEEAGHLNPDDEQEHHAVAAAQM